MADNMSTPINTVSRDNLTVLIRNNIVLNNSVEFDSECEVMETDSPLRHPCAQPISKKLFHSPITDSDSERALPRQPERFERARKAKKRKQTLVPGSCEKIKQAYVTECENDGYSPEIRGGIRKKTLISLFHNKEFCMEFN